MQEKIATTLRTPFEEDVLKGFTDYPKHIGSQYFYDASGDAIFREIMRMPEYYLTDCEYGILERYKEALHQLFYAPSGKLNLIELGAGDGKKTKILLEHFTDRKMNFKYIPVDISQNALDQLTTSLKMEMPDLEVEPVQATYAAALEKFNAGLTGKKVLLFLGSNIGNLLHPKAINFLKDIQKIMLPGDLLFVGFDQKKAPEIILNAYNDPQGITAAFNKNVLKRINRELQGNFYLDSFQHWEVYDPESGTAKSYLISKKAQRVKIEALDVEIHFKPWETIHTEISQKYDPATIKWLAGKAGLRAVANFSDLQGYYRNYVFGKEDDVFE